MKHLTFANVMSCVAVFVALGGTSVAAVSLKRNSVGSAQIKRGAVTNAKIGRSAVTSTKVRNGTLLSQDFKPGQLGAPGPRGATGARGATGKTGSKGSTGAKGATGARGVTGTNGSPGAPGATNVVTRVRSFPLAPGAGSGGFEVACNAGERAVGGGGQFVNSIETLGASAGDVIASSGPSNGTGLPLTEGATPTGWTTSYAYSNGTNRSIRLTAICASP